MVKTCRTALLFIALIAGFNTLYSQMVSYPVAGLSGNRNPDGFVYLLPRHLIKVDVTVTKTEKFKGRYSDFATKLLGITDPITRDGVSYDISRVELSTVAEPDSSQAYFAEIPAKSDGRQIMVQLSAEGFITGFSSVESEEKERIKSLRPQQAFSDLLRPVQIERVDTIIRRVSIDTSIFEEKVPRRSISEKSAEQQAREIADQIYKIEDSKYKLITGYQEVNYTGESIEKMLAKLNKLEGDYLAHFRGAVVTTENVYTFWYTPEANSASLMGTLFRFTTAEGVLPKANPSGDPVTVTLQPKSTWQALRHAEKERVPVQKKAKGIWYRIPEPVDVSVNLGGRTLATARLMVSQMGILTALPPARISHAAFDGNGALKTLIIE